MTSASFKKPSAMAYPQNFFFLVALVGGLAMFLILSSSSLILQPFGSIVRDSFYGVDHVQRIDLISAFDETVVNIRHHSDFSASTRDNDGTGDDFQDSDGGFHYSKKSNPSISQDNRFAAFGQGDGKNQLLVSQDKDESADSRLKQAKSKSLPGLPVDSGSNDGMAQPLHSDVAQHEKGINSSSFSTGTDDAQIAFSLFSNSSNDSNMQIDSLNATQVPSVHSSFKDVTDSPSMLTNTSQGISVDSGCDLSNGKWVYDSGGPLYKNDSCPVLTQTQNCQGNGRPDKDYENWRWKPNECDLPRFNAKKFLNLMRGKTLAFIGDSIARNQMESMLCILWQVEVPKNRGNARMQRYYFRSTSTTMIRIWSAWLVHQTTDQIDFAPAGVVKVHLDAPDEGFMDYIPDFDIIVLSSGHWFTKQSAYILKNEVVGGQQWWPKKSRKMKINNTKAFGISVETILTAMVTHPNYTGLTIVRTFSPDHYEGGLWNTGGSCTGKVKPLVDGELVKNEFTNIMHEKQIRGFRNAIKKKTNKSKLKLMDITEAFDYRHDGHPGPYRSTDPNKITKRGRDGKPPPQDCLHWCMPGPVDTWNEILSEIIRRELEGRQNVSS